MRNLFKTCLATAFATSLIVTPTTASANFVAFNINEPTLLDAIGTRGQCSFTPCALRNEVSSDAIGGLGTSNASFNGQLIGELRDYRSDGLTPMRLPLSIMRQAFLQPEVVALNFDIIGVDPMDFVPPLDQLQASETPTLAAEMIDFSGEQAETDDMRSIVPLPGAALLILTGIAGIIGLRRRQA
ncbi:MAG: VPLPA-CTERM sorting domain-containing protein [Pseudomonadota bacterium]